MKLQIEVKGLSGESLAAANALNAAFAKMPEAVTAEELKAELKSLFGSLITENGKLAIETDTFKKLADQLDEKTDGSLKNILMKQGDMINKLTQKSTSQFSYKSMAQYVTGVKKELDAIKKAKSGVHEMHFKAVTSIAGNTSSVAVPANAYFPLPEDTGEFIDIQLPKLFILDYVDAGNTTSPSLLWTEQAPSVFGAALVVEGGLKPYTTKRAIRRVSQYNKIAAVMTITEELDKDIPKLATQFKRLFKDEILRTQHSQILADIIAVAPGYVSTAMNGMITTPDQYGAIAAAVAQVESLNFEPDFLAMNPVDFWIMNQAKDSIGAYNIPPFVTISMGEMRFAQLRLVVNPAIAVGSFLVGEASTYKVDIYEDYTMRIGYINDDFARNQYSCVGEVKYHSYIPTNSINAWAYTQYALVQNLIAKVPQA